MIGAFRRGGDQETWAPVSDLMAALMLIFMFIAVVYIRSVVDEQATNREECDKIYQVLKTEFGTDFNRWDVEFLEDLTIRFRNPDILFQSQSAVIGSYFQEILGSFFPRYMEIIQSREDSEDRVLIEGHTSSAWVGASTEDERYIRNMELSHDRTLSILDFVLGLPEADDYRDWAKKNITATGMSFSRLIKIEDDSCREEEDPSKDDSCPEDPGRSRRVEFRLLAAACQRAGRQ